MQGWIISVAAMSDYISASVTHVEGREGHIRNTAIPAVL
jgi:hypothetical protein